MDRRIPKKLLLEQGALTTADKRQIQDGIEELLWIAALKPNNIGVPAFKDDVREYLEIAVLTAVVRSSAKPTRPRGTKQSSSAVSRSRGYRPGICTRSTRAGSTVWPRSRQPRSPARLRCRKRPNAPRLNATRSPPMLDSSAKWPHGDRRQSERSRLTGG